MVLPECYNCHNIDINDMDTFGYHPYTNRVVVVDLNGMYVALLVTHQKLWSVGAFGFVIKVPNINNPFIDGFSMKLTNHFVP